MVEISVLMPVYRGELHLKDAIDSILYQTFTNFEFVIINDASPDNSEQIIHSYNDPRIVYKKHEQNKGLVSALNSGLAICKGKYIARMDQDDIADLKRLQLQYNFMEKNPENILLGGNAEIINSKRALVYPISDKAIRAQLIFNTAFVHPTVMLRKSILDKFNLRYSEDYKHAEDYGFWIELTSYGKMANLNETCLYYRRHEGQYTAVFKQEMFQMVKRIRTTYLSKYNIVLSTDDMRLMEIITGTKVDYSDNTLITEIGDFLNRFSTYFEGTEIDQVELKKITYKLWRRICDDRQKLGFSVYKIFIINPLAFYNFDIKAHLYYLKYDIFKRKKSNNNFLF